MTLTWSWERSAKRLDVHLADYIKGRTADGHLYDLMGDKTLPLGRTRQGLRRRPSRRAIV